MSDEYEYEDDERKPRMTFGQILASLLLLGVLVVIGLIVLVYFKLTSPVERVQTAPVEASAPARPVERMTPDGKPALATNPVAPEASASAANNAAKAADEAVNHIQGNTADNAPVEGLNNGALAGGAAAGVTAAQLKKQREAAAARRRAREQRAAERAAAANGEVPAPRRSRNNVQNEGEEIPLQPIQRGERRLTPRNTQSGERELTPRNQGERPLTPRRSSNNAGQAAEQPQRPIRLNPPAEQRERPLTPTRPQGGNKSEINELF